MDNIKEKLVKFRYHILGTLLFLLAIFTISFIAPRFLTLLAYFWPLLLSTALFLALVLIFANTTPSPPTDPNLPKPGEDLLDYVAGHPEVALDPPHNSKSD